MTVNVLALIYGVSAIVILSIDTPAATDAFLDKWLVPISAGVVAIIGLLYLFIAKPKENIQAHARADAITMG